MQFFKKGKQMMEMKVNEDTITKEKEKKKKRAGQYLHAKYCQERVAGVEVICQIGLHFHKERK